MKPGTGTPKPTGYSGREFHLSRPAVLSQNYWRQCQLLSEYEQQRDLSSDPKEIALAESEIEAIKARIQEYRDEYYQLTGAWPEDDQAPM